MKLAVFQNGEIRIQDSLTLPDRTLVPLNEETRGVPYINFADGIEHAEGAEDLLLTLAGLLQATIDVSKEHLVALSAWAMGT